MLLAQTRMPDPTVGLADWPQKVPERVNDEQRKWRLEIQT